MDKRLPYVTALGLSILFSYMDAIGATGYGRNLLLGIFNFPGLLAAWIVGGILFGDLNFANPMRTFLLTLPFNLMWFSLWAWMYNAIRYGSC